MLKLICKCKEPRIFKIMLINRSTCLDHMRTLSLTPSIFLLTKNHSKNKVIKKKKNNNRNKEIQKQQKDLCAENYKTLIKKLKMIQINGKIYHALQLEE